MPNYYAQCSIMRRTSLRAIAGLLVHFILFLRKGGGCSSVEYFCTDGVTTLGDVYDHYGPLCDGESHCPDSSDERHCDSNMGFTGCWSFKDSQSYRLVACENCLCVADVSDCSAQDFLGQSCHFCISDAHYIGDGIEDCIYGIDESSDARRMKGLSVENWREKMRVGDWRCSDSRGKAKKCGSLLKSQQRPFLYAFPRDNGTSESCAVGFWPCADGKCIRQGQRCENEDCPPGYQFNAKEEECKKLICSVREEWICQNKCIPKEHPCLGQCMSAEKYFCPSNGGHCLHQRDPCGPQKTCPTGRSFCQEDGLCIEYDQPCNGWRCLDTARRFCRSSHSCIDPEEPCEQWCPPGRHYLCHNQCRKVTEPCHGDCATTSLWPCTNTNNNITTCISTEAKCNGMCRPGLVQCKWGRQKCLEHHRCPRPNSADTSESATQAMGLQCPQKICIASNCSSGPQQVCSPRCINHTQPCDGICGPGETLCGNICVKDNEHGCADIDTAVSKDVSLMAIAVASGAVLAALVLFATSQCLLFRRHLVANRSSAAHTDRA